MGVEDADFGGYATKANLRCSDGRIIRPEAFKHMDGVQVPLLWQHGHSNPENVLGHVLLEARDDGVYAYGFFNNETKQGVNARALVKHKDVNRLSIWANQLKEHANTVLHGMIREVSLVLAGANPKAVIDYVRIQHSEDPTDVTVSDDEAIIHTGDTFDFVAEEKVVQHADAGSKTVQEIYDSMSTEQQDVLKYMIGVALEQQTSGSGSMGQSDTTEGNLDHKEEEGTGEMTRNVFEQAGATGAAVAPAHTLSHSDVKSIVEAAVEGGSLKKAVKAYALSHGITEMDLLFPEAKTLTSMPEFDKRRTEWVSAVLAGTRKSPFSRIKTLSADITQDEARAKGYIKGNYKKEEWFGIQKRTTTPTTIYKKQKLDRDDVIDITDFDIVMWMKGEMRLMLEEEIAISILIGDGRDPGDEDKIKDPAGAASGEGLRSIANDHELYATTVTVNIGDASSSYEEIIDEIVRARQYYKGTGTPTLYTTEPVIVEMMLLRDTNNRKLYNTREELAASLMVDRIVAVEAMERDATLFGIIVNLADYNIGADKGGEVNLFDDFDIDYNQLKYLIETRISGALTKIKSALVIRKPGADTDTLVDPVTSPTFVASTGVVTIPSQTGVVYKNGDTGATLSSGAQAALDPGETLKVHADPAATYYFRTTAKNDWTFKRPTA